MAMGRMELPEGWTSATIGQIVGADGVFVDGDWVESKDQDPSGRVRLIQLADVGDGEFTDKSARFLTNEKARDLKCTFLHRGDILVARMPDPLGRACIFPLNGDGSFVTVVDVCIVRPGHDFVDPKYLMYAINSPGVRIQIDGHKSGSTRKRISRGNLARVGLPLAPYQEQRRIVAKIEELFSELDNGIANLERARQQLGVYRQAVLKKAFEGGLTADWREEHGGHIGTCQPSKGWDSLTATGRLPSLPAGWSYQGLGLLIEQPRYGTSKKCSYEFEGKGVLRIPNVANGVIDASDLKGASFDDEELATYALNKGDVLVIRSNGSTSIVGKCALISEAEEQYLFAGYLIRLRCNPTALIPEYLALVLSSQLLRNQIEATAKSTSGVNNISAKEIQSLVIPLCSVREQELVVQRLAGGLSTLDALTTEVDTELRRAETLRQAILRKAFAGQLVEQSPRDEPASVLLERIASENGRAARHGNTRRIAHRRRTGT